MWALARQSELETQMHVTAQAHNAPDMELPNECGVTIRAAMQRMVQFNSRWVYRLCGQIYTCWAGIGDSLSRLCLDSQTHLSSIDHYVQPNIIMRLCSHPESSQIAFNQWQGSGWFQLHRAIWVACYVCLDCGLSCLIDPGMPPDSGMVWSSCWTTHGVQRS